MSDSSPKLRVAVVGASSLIGEALIAQLRAQRFPLAELHVLEDQRYVGRPIADEGGDQAGELKTSDVAAFDFSRTELVFFCGRAALAERYAEAAAVHAWVIDNSPAFRLRPGVPLIAAARRWTSSPARRWPCSAARNPAAGHSAGRSPST